VLDAGEDCDTSAGVTCATGPFHTGTGFTCSATCQCACPTFVEFTGAAGNRGVLDSGWTGQGHDATVVDRGTVTVGVTSCAGTSRPCGVCNIAGPVDNLQADAGEINNQRCTGNTRTKCNTNADCATAGGTCEYYFGTYLPLAAGGVATCVGNQINGAITGTANIETGSAASSVQLISRVATGPNPNPCPRCAGDGPANDGIRAGTCDAGPNAGQTCDVNGRSPNPFWGGTSLDCPPDPGAVVATLPINLTNSTGTQTRTLTAANPNCNAAGFANLKCICDTCNDLAAEPCFTNADCTGAGTVCGGKRCIGGTNSGAPCTVFSQCPGGACGFLGQATKPNDCSDLTCSPTNTCVGGTNQNFDCSAASECPGGSCLAGNKGSCLTNGPFEQFCGPNGTFQGCATNTDCGSLNACVGGTAAGTACSVASQCPGGSCQSKVGGTPEECIIGKFRRCFLDNGTLGGTDNATGVVSTPSGDQSTPTLASLFCIGPTSASAVNSAAGLPGLGRLELPGIAKGLP